MPISAGELHLRPARPAERGELENLQRRASLVYDEDREALLANPDAIELPAEQVAAGGVVVAERGGRVAGFSVVLAREDGEKELDGLFVEPDLWRQGIGRALVEAAAERSRREGAGRLFVIANPNALGFYAACGFKVIGEVPTRFRTGLRMLRDLTA